MNEPLNPEVAIFNGALELAPAERSAYLDRACAGNMALREKVEALLKANEQAENFLDVPPTGLPLTRTVRIPITEKPGDKIGRYKLLQQIGEGGCGVVYMAEQEEPVRRRVALKVIKLGMDTKEVIARFEAERQALAMMDHPNIAKVLDAGATNTGRPYFVMELVRGIKITEFCDENKVPTEERLKLFVQVCQAIQHAHQKGIIHRDIKPSNILVTINDGVPVPKVIDFGIAKATQGRLTDQTLFTAFEQFIGTPAYMSPEQALMTSLDIDTRSDIYSLGVLLYELLTGETPFDSKELMQSGIEAMQRVLRDKEPPKPSTRVNTMGANELTTAAQRRRIDAPKLANLLRGDLDWIVMTCLEKDRARRYETANGLAADIQRHLNTEPIVARPPGGLYRLQKAIRRNKFAFAAAAAIAVVLATGVVVSTLEAVRAMRAEREQVRLRQVAETKEKKSEQVAQFLKDMLKSVGPKVALGRDTKLLHDILDATAERVGKDLRNQPEIEAELLSTIGSTYLQLPDLVKAEKMQREALRLRRSLFNETNELIADSLNDLARVLVNRQERDPIVLSEAESMARQSLAIRKKLFGTDHPDVASSLYVLGSDLFWQNRLTEAEAAMREGVAIRRKILGEPADMGASLNNLATILIKMGKLSEAEAALREALVIERKGLGTIHPGIADLLDNLSDLLLSQGRLAEAEPLAREGLDMRRKLYGDNHPKAAYALVLLGEILRREGKLTEARTIAEEAIAIGHRPDIESWACASAYRVLRNVLWELDDEPAIESLDLQSLQQFRAGGIAFEAGLAEVLAHRADWLLTRNRFDEAEQLVRGEAIPIMQRLLKKRTNDCMTVIQLGYFQWQLGRALQTAGKLIQAEKVYLEALQVFTQAYRDFPNEPFLRREQASSQRDIASLLLQLKRIDEAEAHYRAAIALYSALKQDSPADVECHREEAYTTWLLARKMDKAGRTESAVVAYRQAITLFEAATSKFPEKQDLKRRLTAAQADLASILARTAEPPAKP